MSNYVPATASTLSSLSATALRKIAWNNKLRTDSVRPSIFSQLKTEFEISDMGEIIVTKPGLMLDVTNVGKAEGAQSVRCGLRTPLRRRPQYGNASTEDMLGNEDESGLLWAQLYYNEIKKAVKYNQWGYDFNDLEVYNYNGGYNTLLSNFHAENDDDRIQQALLLTVADELTYAPVSKVCQFNKNWAIPNIDQGNNPAWDDVALTVTDGAADSDFYFTRDFSGATTIVENIAAAMVAGSGTGATPKATLTVDTLASITSYIIGSHVVEPMMIDGIPSYIWKIPTPTKGWMENPNNTGSLGLHMEKVSQYKDPKRLEIIGELGRVFEQFILVHDTRCATLTLSGSAGSYKLRPGFLHPGNNDDRNQSAWSTTSGSKNYVWDVSTILGANAIARYRRDDLVMNLSEQTEYGKRKGLGTYKGEGIQLLTYDYDTTSNTQIQRGSCVVPVSRAPIATIA